MLKKFQIFFSNYFLFGIDQIRKHISALNLILNYLIANGFQFLFLQEKQIQKEEKKDKNNKRLF